jgi:glycosyltransferase involved in cell wall biosynthesis
MRLVIDLQGAQGSSHARGIGRYSRELALAMAREARDHEVIIALNAAFPDTAEALTASFSSILPRAQIRCWHSPHGTAISSDAPARRAQAEVLRAQFLASLQPDLVHVSSMFEGLVDDAVTMLPQRMEPLPVVATCYDLIPLIRHDEYFGAHEPSSSALRWYYRCAQEMASCEGLLAISESSREEAIGHLPYRAERVFNIQAGISDSFRPAQLPEAERMALLRRYGLRESFILFLGAGDIRKNEAGLIAAYARLPAALQQKHQLLIVGKMDQERLRRVAAEQRVSTANFVIVPFVPEEDLNALYSSCGVFVFPSVHEGFGLPVAEAMACGAPVIASNTTSLPEVVGREDATFDPMDPDSIAACMRRVLENPAFRSELAAYGPVQAGRFTWHSSANRAWDALEAIQDQRRGRQAKRPAALLRPKPRLAFVAPLPPQATGIADYCAELLPALAQHYDITLVSEEPTDAIRLDASFPQLSPGDFLQSVQRFDRVLYHIGNSPFHRYQIEDLLPLCPGVVMLHDAFLSNHMEWLCWNRGQPEQFRAVLLASHGYPALSFMAREGREATLAQYPCTLPVLQQSVGVIQHSDHAVDVLRQHFGEDAAASVSVVPHLRALRRLPDRTAARALLGLADDFVVCSFGGVNLLKGPHLLAEAWKRSGLKGRLFFAGGAPPDLQASLEDPGAGIHCTGRLTREEYDAWLAAADLAVQWRTGSRGESSGAVADALMAGLPVVLNRHGASGELPDDLVLALPDEAAASELATALVGLHGDPARRRTLGAAGQAFVRAELAPEAIALRYRDAIEQAYARPLQPVIASQLQQNATGSMTSADHMAFAQAVARGFPQPWRGARRNRLLIDISVLAQHDAGTGIQRVVRELCRHLLQAPPPGLRGEAVRMKDRRLRHTSAVPLRLLDLPAVDMPETAVDARPGDILLCADLNGGMSPEEYEDLRLLRLQGVRIVLVVYDLLPITHPELFPEVALKAVQSWYIRMTAIADGVACISRAVADEVVKWLDAEPQRRTSPLPIGYFHLGADFKPMGVTGTVSPTVQQALSSAGRRPTVVMTGTVEPRKGYPQALAAFETLWEAGHDIGLVIIGRLGWRMEAFAEGLRKSPHLGERLHWISGCSDAELQRIYAAGSGLLMASNHEGFGLPIIEAAHARLPVLARDLPVFREIAGEHATYFTGDSPEALADTLQAWAAAGFTPGPAGIRPLSWDESYAQLCALILEEKWHTVWQPPED